MLRLYTRENTGRPARVRWALEEAGAPYDWISLTADECAGDEHRRRQPLGRVPALETDDGPLFESAALCLQVADLHPAANLIPPVGSQERGEVYQWAVFAASELEPAILQVWRLGEESGTPAAGTAHARLDAVLGALSERLAGHDYLVGDRFTVADIVIGSVLSIADRLGLRPEPPAVDAYLARLEARPAKQRAFEGYLARIPQPR